MAAFARNNEIQHVWRFPLPGQDLPPLSKACRAELQFGPPLFDHSESGMQILRGLLPSMARRMAYL